MKIAFVFEPLSLSEPLGVLYLTAVLRKNGHQVRAFFAGDSLVGDLRRYGPSIIGFSLIAGNHDRYLKLNRHLKRRLDYLSVFGGPYPTYFPEIIEREAAIDAVCRGDGEAAFPDLIDRLDRGDPVGQTQGFWIRDGDIVHRNTLGDLIVDLDSIPFPDRELIYSRDRVLRDLPVKRFVASRGCPYSCSYCFNHTFHELTRGKGPVVRARSVDNVIAEIAEVRDRYGVRIVKLVDDNINTRDDWLPEFVETYRRQIDLPFVCNIRPNHVTRETASLLREGGCRFVQMGVECGDERYREQVLNRHISDEQHIEAAEHLHREGIMFTLNNMLGLPGETKADIYRTIALNARLRPQWAGFSIYQPLPRTKLAEYAVERGLFDGDFSQISEFHKVSILDRDDKREVENLQRLAPLVVFFPWLEGIVDRLIKLPPNLVFDLILPLSRLARESRMYRLRFSPRAAVDTLARFFRAYYARRRDIDVG